MPPEVGSKHLTRSRTHAPGEIFGNMSLVFAGSSAGVFGTPGADTKARRARVYRRHNNGADSLFSALFISTHSLKIFRGMLWITQSTEKHSLCILLKGTLSAEHFFKVYFVLLYLALFFFSPDVFALRNTIWRISHCSRDSGWRLVAICPFIFHASHDLYMLG